MINEKKAFRVRKALSESIHRNELAGANLLVIKDGNEILYHEDGMADRESGLPIRRNSIFRLYSMSKPITAAAVMILLERGEIDLYEPVSKFLPSFKNQMVGESGCLVPACREVLLKDLLSMTGGLVYGGGDSSAEKATEALFREIETRLLGNSPIGTVEAMNRLGECPLAFQPGSSWQYGTSADVLGAVVEVVSGKRFGQFLKEKIFQPLEMDDTGFWLPEEKRQRLTKTYEHGVNGKLELYSENHLGIIHQMNRDPAFESGGAGLVSTIDDYSKFAVMLLNGGSFNGVQILRPKTAKYMTSATLNDQQQKSFNSWITLAGHSYGNLMRVMTNCGMAGDLGCLGEYGWDGWLGAYFCNCPNENLTFLLMMQLTGAGTTSLTRKLRNIILDM